ncbi:DENND6A, partial [Cordylochernes scorpioides]
MEQRAVIKFNAKLGRSASETYVFIWHKRFSDGRNTLEDDKHTGRPSSSKTPESIEKPLTPTILPWDRFSQWVHCVCVVTFDLELGQAMELIYPPHVKLTEREKNNVCYLAFPDSNSGCMGDTQFWFRIRQCPPSRRLCPALLAYNKQCPTSLQSDPSYLYGFAYFRQVRDKSIRRGYFQKSVVILTRLPFSTLFPMVLSILAPSYFTSGEPSIEAVCHDIDQWPPPTPGLQLNLPLFGSLIKVRISSKSDKMLVASPTNSPTTQLIDPATYVLNSINNTDLFTSFLPVIRHIQLLWELVITNEPIVIISSSPAVSSQMVNALVSMIAPLKFCSDFRPFFTIHDSEFKEFTSKLQAPPPVILGVTNPFFAKTLQHWPHIIRVGGVDLLDSTHHTPTHKTKIKKSVNLKTIDSKPGLYTEYKPFLQKDKSLLKKLYKGFENQRPDAAQNVLLRRYLMDLTQSFMIPLERYISSLLPLQRNISPYKGTPTLGPFNPDDFLKTVDSCGPHLTSGIRGDWAGLYRRFFRSANFSGWYNARHAEVTQKLQALHIEAISDADLLQWIRDKQEVEIVDLVLKLREKLSTAEQLPLLPQTVHKINLHLEGILSTLPEDLRHVLAQS